MRRRALLVLGACLFLLCANAPAASHAQSRALLRAHVNVTLTAHGVSTADRDFVLTAGSATQGKGTILGYASSNYPGEGPVLTTFYRGVLTPRAQSQLKSQVEALNPSDMPAKCSLDGGAFMTGSYELTLYALGDPEGKVITVTFDHQAATASQCPSDVAALLEILDTFIGKYAHPI